jgi:hypothetical protein
MNALYSHMTLYYESYSLRRIDFYRSTDAPYDMDNHWKRRAKQYVFVHDKKRNHHPPDIVSWCGMTAAVTPYASDIPPPTEYFNGKHGFIHVAINTADGVFVFGRTPSTPFISQVGPDFADLKTHPLLQLYKNSNNKALNRQFCTSQGPACARDVTTDWYTDELVCVWDNTIVKKKGNQFHDSNAISMGSLHGIASVGNVCYTIDDQYIHMYDDRVSGRDPLVLYDGWGDINFYATTRMISEVIIEIGYIDTVTTDYTANMVLFDVRSPYAFAAQMTPVPVLGQYHMNTDVIF